MQTSTIVTKCSQNSEYQSCYKCLNVLNQRVKLFVALLQTTSDIESMKSALPYST